MGYKISFCRKGQTEKEEGNTGINKITKKEIERKS
jgi:hypothetical protein